MRNILTEKELAKTKNIKDICNYFISFVNFLKIVVNLQNALDNCGMINELDENLDEKFLEFCQNDCSDLFLMILKLKFQILKLKTITKIPKFLLKTYAHVYFKVMDFSLNLRHGSYALTTKIFFENVY